MEPRHCLFGALLRPNVCIQWHYNKQFQYFLLIVSWMKSLFLEQRPNSQWKYVEIIINCCFSLFSVAFFHCSRYTVCMCVITLPRLIVSMWMDCKRKYLCACTRKAIIDYLKMGHYTPSSCAIHIRIDKMFSKSMVIPHICCAIHFICLKTTTLAPKRQTLRRTEQRTNFQSYAIKRRTDKR